MHLRGDTVKASLNPGQYTGCRIKSTSHKLCACESRITPNTTKPAKVCEFQLLRTAQKISNFYNLHNLSFQHRWDNTSVMRKMKEESQSTPIHVESVYEVCCAENRCGAAG